MSLSIWKYSLNGSGRQKLSMPFGARILTMQLQDDVPTLWALVDPWAASQMREFETFGTGWDYVPSTGYIGTWQKLGFVWHVFEITK